MRRAFGQEYSVLTFPLAVIENNQVVGGGFLDAKSLYALATKWLSCSAVAKVNIGAKNRMFFRCAGAGVSHLVAVPFDQQAIDNAFREVPVDLLLGSVGVMSLVLDAAQKNTFPHQYSNSNTERLGHKIVMGRLQTAEVPVQNRAKLGTITGTDGQ